MHLEWGLAGLREGGRLADVIVVVDVLSFSTAVVTAVDLGIPAYPMREVDDYAPRIADRLGARLLGRPSPAAVAEAAHAGPVVLPSPNGGAMALEAAAAGATVVAGSLRNASAVGRWLGDRPRRVVVVAAGEQWRDGSPRFAVEDLLGAGAVLAAVPDTALSAEAQVAVDAYRTGRPNVAAILHSCTSGRELAARGMFGDVRWAAEVDTSSAVPVLVDGAFRDRR